jgi:O-antigen/teichoic acid export membrane protein
MYTGGAAGIQLVMATFFAAIPLIAAAIGHFLGLHITWLMLGLSAAVFCWQLQEFARQVQFTNARVGEVLRLDIVSYGGQALIIATLWANDALTGPAALFVLAGTSLASAIYGFSRIEMGSLWRTLRPAMRSNWRFGKWLLADNMGQWLSLFIYPVAVAVLVSATAAGALRTAQNVVQPMYILVNAFQSLMLPRVSRAYAEGGQHAMFRLLAPATVVVFVMLFAYAGLVGLFGKQILGALYGHAYDEYAGLIWYCGLGYLFWHLTSAAALALMVQGRTRSIFISRMVVVPFTLTAGMWITWQYGLYGAAFASCVLASAAILGMQYAFLLHGERRGRGTSRSDTSLAATGGNSR